MQIFWHTITWFYHFSLLHNNFVTACHKIDKIVAADNLVQCGTRLSVTTIFSQFYDTMIFVATPAIMA